MVKNGVINKEKARDIRGWSDGFTLAVNVTGSVMDYRLDSIEAVCFSLTVRLVSTWGLKTSNIRMLVSRGVHRAKPVFQEFIRYQRRTKGLKHLS